MRLLPSNKPEPKSSKPIKNTSLLPTLIAVALVGLVGIASILPQLGQQRVTKEVTSPLATTVTMQDNEQDNSTINVFWSNPTSQAQFWFNNKLVKATCEAQNCVLPKPTSTEQVYFRWLDTADNQWYYFQCNGDYRGQFKGLPVAAQ